MRGILGVNNLQNYPCYLFRTLLKEKTGEI